MTGSHRAPITRFDQIVWLVLAAAVAATGFLVVRGDQIGLGTVSLIPAAGAAAISTRTEIAVQFDQNVATSPELIRIALDPPVAGQTRVEGSQIIFTPAVGLAANTTYTVQVESGIVGVRGRTLNEAITWRFATRPPRVLFAATANDVNQLFLVNAPLPGEQAAEPPLQLTAAPAGVWEFAVAPDGSQIIYSAVNEAGGADLWSTTGANESALLLECGTAFCSTPAISPDSRLLAYSKRNPNEFAAAAVSPPRLYIMDLQTKEAAPLSAGGQQLGTDPQWSAGGRWIAYVAPDRGGVVIVNLDSGAETLYPTMMGESGSWNPQRDRLVMAESAELAGNQVAHLFLVDPAQGTKQNLSGETSLVQDNAPSWSPDGEWIAFRRNELTGEYKSLSKQLWVMRADGTDAVRLTSNPEFDHSPPAWSPDGRYLLYHKFPLKGAINLSVWMMDPATGQEWQVVSNGQRPLWVP